MGFLAFYLKEPVCIVTFGLAVEVMIGTDCLDERVDYRHKIEFFVDFLLEKHTFILG